MQKCTMAATSDHYRSYLEDYLFGSLPQTSPYCVVPLGNNQAIVYVEVTSEFLAQDKKVGYNEIPKCYGLMTTDALEDTGVVKLRRNPYLSLRGNGTLVGFIDTGIQLDHPIFRYEDGTTKVRALWDQSEKVLQNYVIPVERAEGEEEDGILFGREWSEEEINNALTSGGVLPKDEVGHGTFLAAVAAGRENGKGFSGVAPDAGIIVVKLKQAKPYLRDFYSIDSDVWACQEDDILLGIRYILNKAIQLKQPVSICIGVGSGLGGHGGSDALSRNIAANNIVAGVTFQIAGGNEGISGHHFKGRIAKDAEYETLDFNVAVGENGFVLELWGNSGMTFSVALISPGGEYTERILLKMGEFRSIQFFPEETVLEIRSFPGDTIIGEQVIRMNFKKPSPGVWKMFVYRNGTTEQWFDIWMPISNFLKDETVFLNPDSSETLTSPANAIYGTTYVPYDVHTDSLYIRASRGYTSIGIVKPDLAAPGVAVAIPNSIPGGKEITQTGSSVAAAFGTGIGALMMEWGIVQKNDPTMNGQNIRFDLVNGAVRASPYEYPNEEWGYGKVNIYDAFFAMRER